MFLYVSRDSTDFYHREGPNFTTGNSLEKCLNQDQNLRITFSVSSFLFGASSFRSSTSDFCVSLVAIVITDNDRSIFVLSHGEQ